VRLVSSDTVATPGTVAHASGLTGVRLSSYSSQLFNRLTSQGDNS
jgi:hypothetical protein